MKYLSLNGGFRVSVAAPNLSIQERRLRNQLVDDLTDLRDLPEECRQQVRAELVRAVQIYEETQQASDDVDRAEFGFEFSMEEIEEHLAYLTLVREGRSHVLARKAKQAA